jgi:2-polyprenyl-3-methyl-5-hydroxy-6-metoxy-1,4-benzoquinol methylase
MRGVWRLKQILTKVVDAIDPTFLNYKGKGDRVDLAQVYTLETNFTRNRDVYFAFAKCIDEVIRPRRGVIDVGCAAGYTLSYFHERKLNVFGLDGVPTAFDRMDDAVKPHVQIRDLREDIRPVFSDFDKSKYDLVVCTEVIEHLEPAFEDVFLDNVNQFVTDTMVFSWSPEWDPARGTPLQQHWNPKPYKYAVNKLCKNYGLTFCETETNALKERFAKEDLINTYFRHWIKNIIVLRKKTAEASRAR